MTTKQREGDYGFHVEGEHDWALAMEMTVRCAFCGEEFTGPASWGIEWNKKHRRKKHPQAKDRGMRARVAAKKAATWSNFKRQPEFVREFT